MQMLNNIHQPKLARVIAIINMSDSSINRSTSTSSIILDPIFPALKSCSDYSTNTIFGRQFGIHFRIGDKNGLYK